MVRAAKRERVHSHLSRPRPFGAARVVTDATDLEVPGREMADRVATDDETIAGRTSDRSIQVVDYLGGGPRRTRGERPTVLGQRGAHLKTPTPKDVERGVIVFDQLEAPLT